MKLITEQDCPHCKTHYEGEIELEQLQTIQPEKAKINVKGQIPEQKPEEKPQIEEKIKTVVKVPSHIPKFKCKNCDKLHDNPNYNKRPRFKCSNCGTLNPTEECEMCDKGEEFEELTDEDLDELGIKTPSEKEHPHTHEDE